MLSNISFCLQVEVNTSDIYSHRLNCCSCIEQWIYTMLAHLNYHAYTMLVVVFTLVSGVAHGSDLLVCL